MTHVTGPSAVQRTSFLHSSIFFKKEFICTRLLQSSHDPHITLQNIQLHKNSHGMCYNYNYIIYISNLFNFFCLDMKYLKQVEFYDVFPVHNESSSFFLNEMHAFRNVPSPFFTGGISLCQTRISHSVQFEKRISNHARRNKIQDS